MIFINEETEFIAGGQEAASEMDQLVLNEGIAVGEFFSDDETGAVEIVLEMETSWAALVQDMAAIEHKAIVNESAEILNEGLKEWWTAIVNFFKKVWAYISSWFRKVWDWVTRRFQNADKLWKANAESITVKSTKFNTYPMVASGAAGNAGKIELNLNKAVDSAKTKEQVDKLRGKASPKELLGEMLGAKERKELVISKDAIKNILEGSNVWLAGFKASNNTQAAKMKEGIAVANAGLKTADGKEAEKLKKQVELIKAQVAVKKLIDATSVKAINIMISDAFACAKQMLRESGKSDKK